jgi:hypothetical protein
MALSIYHARMEPTQPEASNEGQQASGVKAIPFNRYAGGIYDEPVAESTTQDGGAKSGPDAPTPQTVTASCDER